MCFLIGSGAYVREAGNLNRAVCKKEKLEQVGRLKKSSNLALSRHNIGTVLRFRCKSKRDILSMPKTVKSPFVSQKHHPFEGGVLCFRAIGQFAGDGLQGRPFPQLCITGGITSEKT